MPRQHRRKTTRWINEDCMQSAVADICSGVETPSTAARKYGLKRTTIIYRVEKKQKMDLARGNNPEEKHVPTPLLAEIFSAKQEKELMEYLNRYTYLPYDTSGSYKAARQLVYQFVKTHEIKHPKLWDVEQQASIDWLKGFIIRNPQTNLRKPATDSPKKSDEDDDTSNDTQERLHFITQIRTTDTSATPLKALPMKPICKKIESSEPSLESDISQTYSFSHFMDSSSVQPQQLTPNSERSQSCQQMDKESEIEFEPDCDIVFPIVSIKQESEANTDDLRAREETESKSNFSKLNFVPDDDDVFNSFGRNVAFQVKELHRFNRLEAFELMHEVQATVNRRLTTKLRLMRSKENSTRTSAILLPRVIKIDDEDDDEL